jgi:hypothetical protein
MTTLNTTIPRLFLADAQIQSVYLIDPLEREIDEWVNSDG